MTYEDTKLDIWLNKHPRVDKVYSHFMIYYWCRVRGLKQIYPRWKRMRPFRPGSFYLDHGTEPCVVVSIEDEAILGVSMVDGRLVGGCDLWHCGPVPVTMQQAGAAVKRMKEERDGR